MEINNLGVALQDVDAARKQIHVAYSEAVNTNKHHLSILLRDLLGEVRKIQDRMTEIESLS